MAKLENRYKSFRKEIPPDQKKRKCLYCGILFLSDWKGHRFCEKCKKIINK